MNLSEKRPDKFRHIYIEEDVLASDEVRHICAHFPKAEKIIVKRYTDIFNRRKQSYSLQHAYQNLILARKQNTFLYPGSPVCQDFDYKYFYYTAPVMNCIYDCEYCWLKGMYPSGNLVVFVNQQAYFDACEKVLAEHPLYLCISFDADLLSLEPLLGYVHKWAEFTCRHDNLTIEVRTKAADYEAWKDIPVNERVIFAFTLSPDEVVNAYEHGTPSLSMRLQAVQKALKDGRKVRLCIDPMIPVPDWKNAYEKLVDEVHQCIDLRQVKDASIGTFRISAEYLKRMRESYPDSGVIQYPYVNENGFYHLPFHLDEKMESFIRKELGRYMDEKKIFSWEDRNV